MKNKNHDEIKAGGMKTDPDPKIQQSTLLGLAAILLWSSSVALARSISERIGPLTAGLAVYLTAGLILAGNFYWRGHSLGQFQQLPRRYVIGCGGLFCLYTASLYLALGQAANHQQTLEIGLLNYLWPALTILFSLGILGKKARLTLLPATLLALGGVFLVLTPGQISSTLALNVCSNPLAYGLGLSAAVSWALYSNLTRRWGTPNSGAAILMFMFITSLLFATLRLFKPEPSDWNGTTLVEIVALGAATALGYLFWDIAMREGDVILVAACSYATPLLSTMVSCLYLGIMPGIRLWLGCAFIIGGSYFSWRAIERRYTG
jgi:drug/metabolite transporter (DMT)-like permease